MYVRYKKNIQENDLPRKRVRKASKIAGSGGQYLEIRYPERGRKRVITYQKRITPCLFGNKMPREGTETIVLVTIRFLAILFGNKMPREGTETKYFSGILSCSFDLKIRCPERGRKPDSFNIV